MHQQANLIILGLNVLEKTEEIGEEDGLNAHLV